jgi:hypothetical protein
MKSTKEAKYLDFQKKLSLKTSYKKKGSSFITLGEGLQLQQALPRTQPNGFKNEF